LAEGGRSNGNEAHSTIYSLSGTPLCLDSCDSFRLSQVGPRLLFVWPASVPSRLSGKGWVPAHRLPAVGRAGRKGHNAKKTPYWEALRYTQGRELCRTATPLGRAASHILLSTPYRRKRNLASLSDSFQDPSLHSQTQWVRLRAC